MRAIQKISLSLTELLGSTTMIWAQPPPPPATPIDGGLSLLLIAGGLFGAKKISEKRKQ